MRQVPEPDRGEWVTRPRERARLNAEELLLRPPFGVFGLAAPQLRPICPSCRSWPRARSSMSTACSKWLSWSRVALPGLMTFDFGHVRQRGLFAWDSSPSVQAEAGDATASVIQRSGPNPGMRCARAASDQAGVPSGSKASASSAAAPTAWSPAAARPLQAGRVPPHKQAACNRPAADADPRMPHGPNTFPRSSGAKVTSMIARISGLLRTACTPRSCIGVRVLAQARTLLYAQSGGS
jgi:hypothetical protein